MHCYMKTSPDTVAKLYQIIVFIYTITCKLGWAAGAFALLSSVLSYLLQSYIPLSSPVISFSLPYSDVMWAF